MHGKVAYQSNKQSHGDNIEADVRQAACYYVPCEQALSAVDVLVPR